MSDEGIERLAADFLSNLFNHRGERSSTRQPEVEETPEELRAWLLWQLSLSEFENSEVELDPQADKENVDPHYHEVDAVINGVRTRVPCSDPNCEFYLTWLEEQVDRNGVEVRINNRSFGSEHRV